MRKSWIEKEIMIIAKKNRPTSKRREKKILILKMPNGMQAMWVGFLIRRGGERRELE